MRGRVLTHEWPGPAAGWAVQEYLCPQGRNSHPWSDVLEWSIVCRVSDGFLAVSWEPRKFPKFDIFELFCCKRSDSKSLSGIILNRASQISLFLFLHPNIPGNSEVRAVTKGITEKLQESGNGSKLCLYLLWFFLIHNSFNYLDSVALSCTTAFGV